MARPLLTDALWNEIARFFPTYQPSPRGGRPPIPHRTVLTAILFVLKTGIPWHPVEKPRHALYYDYIRCIDKPER